MPISVEDVAHAAHSHRVEPCSNSGWDVVRATPNGDRIVWNGSRSGAERVAKECNTKAAIRAVLKGLMEKRKVSEDAGYQAAFKERHHRPSDGFELDGSLLRWLNTAREADYKAELARLNLQMEDTP